MQRKVILAVVFWFGFASSCLALVDETTLRNMENRVNRLLASEEGKVGVCFIDLGSGQSFQVNSSQEYPAASVAKVSVMATAYHLSALGKLNLEKKVLFRESDKLGGSGVLRWMRGGRTYTLRNLIRLMIVLSDNTASRLVVNAIGTAEINNYLASIGLEKSMVRDPTMLKEPPAPDNNLAAPGEIAVLLKEIYHGMGFLPAHREEMLGYLANQRYRWGIWRGVNPGVVIADKTGNLESILNDAGIIFTRKGDYILSVFTFGYGKKRDACRMINEVSRVVFEGYTGEEVRKAERARKAKGQKVIRRKLSRRPSVSYRQRLGRHGGISGRKLRTYRRR